MFNNAELDELMQCGQIVEDVRAGGSIARLLSQDGAAAAK
jgi:hypothetical protein